MLRAWILFFEFFDMFNDEATGLGSWINKSDSGKCGLSKVYKSKKRLSVDNLFSVETNNTSISVRECVLSLHHHRR